MNVDPADISIDDDGRVVIANADVAAAMKEYLENPRPAGEVDPLGNQYCVNGGCVNPL